MFSASTTITTAFAQGKSKKSGANQSTGNALYYHGNKIAEWRKDGLYISNGGYTGNRGETGSKTTKEKLNTLPNVRISQVNFKWILNGKGWDGQWIKIEGVAIPEIDTRKNGLVFDLTKKYVRIDSWRGYEEFENAIVGANDTGMWDDSPCRSDVAERELTAIAERLRSNGIETIQRICESHNVFCVHHYLIPMAKFVDQGRVIVKEYLNTERTELAYIVE